MAPAMNVYCELPGRGALRVAGPDSREFLQGQTTCDFAALGPETSLRGAHCTPQGRVVCDFQAIALGQRDCLLIMHRQICAGSAEALGRYSVFSKAEVADRSGDWRIFALWGGRLPAMRPGPDERGAIWMPVDQDGGRWECYCPAGQAAATRRRLAELAEAGGEADWQLAEIDAGLGHIEPATVAMFIPQMLNYQATGHVSFAKGCYTGQEVVARMHYRGKLKRPMHLADIEADPPAAGTPVFQHGSQQSVGNIVNSAATADGCRALAVCTTQAAQAGARLASPDGPRLAFRALPYSLADS